jgi:hypothetical protein
MTTLNYLYIQSSRSSNFIFLFLELICYFLDIKKILLLDDSELLKQVIFFSSEKIAKKYIKYKI